MAGKRGRRPFNDGYYELRTAVSSTLEALDRGDCSGALDSLVRAAASQGGLLAAGATSDQVSSSDAGKNLVAAKRKLAATCLRSPGLSGARRRRS